MKVSASPIQMKQMLYTKIYVEPVEFEESKKPEEIWAPLFDFEGVVIKTEIQCVIAEGQEEDPENFMISIAVSIPNEDKKGKRAPYSISLHADAWFEISKTILPEKRESLISVNGASMMIGAIREQVSLLTARSVYGPMTLPSLRVLPPIDDDIKIGK